MSHLRLATEGAPRPAVFYSCVEIVFVSFRFALGDGAHCIIVRVCRLPPRITRPVVTPLRIECSGHGHCPNVGRFVIRFCACILEIKSFFYDFQLIRDDRHRSTMSRTDPLCVVRRQWIDFRNERTCCFISHPVPTVLAVRFQVTPVTVPVLVLLRISELPAHSSYAQQISIITPPFP